jgi:cyclopropane fatty-acyl-phospholipid synthase-like methyltransferase
MIKEASSFRDPDSSLFYDSSYFYRRISLKYEKHYNHFNASGLKDKLLQEGFILPFDEIIDESPEEGISSRVLRTDVLPFVSYPYEWSFSQFKEAALLTLIINQIALEYGMILKDASMFNIQFIGCKPVFIDLASFEVYERDTPWKAYYQFCKHFYGPLFLAAKKNIILPKLLQYFIDGIPLKEVVSMCSWMDFLNFGAFLHLYLHAKGEGKLVKGGKENKVAIKQLSNIFSHLESAISNLKIKQKQSVWDAYNQNNNYEIESQQHKVEIIKGFLDQIEGSKALDIGANDGLYSQLLADKGMYTLVVDIDELAVDRAFKGNYNLIHPIQMNLVNPTPAIGWNNIERKSFWDRCKVDVIQALAIVHHLVITHDISFEEIAKKLAQHTKYLIIEFIDPDDSQVQILLLSKPNRKSIYDQFKFEKIFNSYFNLIEKQSIMSSKRIMYLYKTKNIIE